MTYESSTMQNEISPLRGDISLKALIILGMVILLLGVTGGVWYHFAQAGYQKKIADQMNVQRNREMGIPIPTEATSTDQAAETLQHNEEGMTQQRDAMGVGGQTAQGSPR